MSNLFVFVRVCSPCDSAKRCASFVGLSPSTHIRANMRWRQYLCSVCVLAYCTPGKRSHFWDNSLFLLCPNQKEQSDEKAEDFLKLSL